MIKDDVILGKNVIVHNPQLVNLYGCVIGDGTRIGAFVEIRKGVHIGKNCKIQAGVFIPEGVTVEDNVFLGPNVVFTNDKFPKATSSTGASLEEGDWELLNTVVKKGASIGANSTIIAGIIIGENCLIGAGSVVTKDVKNGTTVYGNPAKEK